MKKENTPIASFKTIFQKQFNKEKNQTLKLRVNVKGPYLL